MAKLVTRFYDPSDGRVRIDGHDLRDVTMSSLRRQLGVVPQEPFLFAGTIRDNIAFAQPDASDDEVREAVEKVGLADVVERMPHGVDTVVHERGQSLSSGERQLIALARAFLAHPRVLVLDEATSNLDLQSETKIEAALDVLLAGPDGDPHRPPADHRHAGGLDRRRRGRHGGGDGAPRRPCGARRPLRRDVRHVGPAGRGRAGGRGASSAVGATSACLSTHRGRAAPTGRCAPAHSGLQGDLHTLVRVVQRTFGV